MTKSQIVQRFAGMAVFFGIVFFFAGGGTSGKVIGALLFVAGVGGLASAIERE